MSLEVPEVKISDLRRDLRTLATGKPLLRDIDKSVKGVLRQEFATGAGPNGDWKKTVRNEQALMSKKLPQAFRSTIDGSVLKFSAKTKRDLLTAHQEGHTFPHRQVGEHKQRVLPQRPIVPTGNELPGKWAEAVEAGVTAGMERWYDKAIK